MRQKYQHFYNIYGLIICLAIVALAISFLANYQYLRSEITQLYIGNNQKLTEANLNTYEDSYLSAVNNYYGDSFSAIESIATNPTIYNAITSNDSATLNSQFTNELNYSQQFDTILAYSPAQADIAYASDYKSSSTASTSSRSPLSNVISSILTSRKASISPGFMSRAKRLVVAFVAPVYGPNANYVGSIDGNATLTTLSDRLAFLVRDNNFSSILVDAKGDILEKDNTPTTSLENIANKESILKTLTSSGTLVLKNETNYLGQRVLAEGTLINFSNAGKVYVISYSPDNVSASVNSAVSSFFSDYRKFVLANFLFLITSLVICYYAYSKIKIEKQQKP